MRIEYIRISNFKSIDNLEIKDIENALILVGQNNTGKSTVIDAIRAVCGDYKIQFDDFDDSGANIEISIRLRIFDSDLANLQKMGLVSRCRRYEPWLREFGERLPSYVPDGEEFEEPDGGVLSFTFYANRTGKVRWDDGFRKNNQWISTIFPKIYYMDAERNLTVFSRDMLFLQENEEMKCMKAGCCIFDHAKKCNHCFSCIGLINRKTVEDLTAFETLKLLEYKTYQMNLDEFSAKVNRIYRRNGGQDTIVYSMNNDVESMLTVNTEIHTDADGFTRPVSYMGRGMRSIYMLSLLEADLDDSNYPCIIMMEEPEMSLHPTLQKKSGDILYRLSKKHQVIFTTHSPNLLPNFNSRQIRQMVCDGEGRSVVKEKTDISVILSDLGYTAEILNTKDVDLSFQTKGTVASGYTLKEITYSPKKVRIKGETDVLNKVAKITIPDDVLDMSGAAEDVETTVDITSYLPDGTSLVLAADAKVEVKVKVEPITTKTFEVDASAFTLENIPDATKAKITEDTIQVEVTGAESDIKKLSADDITGTVNLQGYGNGEHNIVADIDVDNELYQVKTVRIPVKMTAEDTEIKSTESSKKSASKTK